MKILIYIMEDDYEKNIKAIKDECKIMLFFEEDCVNDDNFEQWKIYDYIMLYTYDEIKSKSIKKLLINQGIENKKILEWCYYHLEPRVSQIEKYQNIYKNIKWKNYIFGMSHSYGGIIEELWSDNTFKFSAPSMDLYYHYLVLKELDKNNELFNVERIIFELPYYIFNLDVSKCDKTFKKRINYYYYYKDYHHYDETSEGKEIIYNFEKLSELTGNVFYTCHNINDRGLDNNFIIRNIFRIKYRLAKIYTRLRFKVKHLEQDLWTEERIKSINAMHPHIWYKKYSETQKENLLIWEEIKKVLEKYAEIKWYVCVFPFSPYFIQKNFHIIEENKKEFYTKINVKEEKILDYMTYFDSNPGYFTDECHLNRAGAYEFTKILEKDLKDRR